MPKKQTAAARRPTNVVYICDFLTAKGEMARARRYAPPPTRRLVTRPKRSTVKDRRDASLPAGTVDGPIGRAQFDFLLARSVAAYHSEPHTAASRGEPLFVRMVHILDGKPAPTERPDDVD